MSARSRPLAPWYAPATRRLAVLRVGLPTLVVCVFAMGPVLAASMPGQAAHGVAMLAVRTAQGAISAPDGHPDGDGDGHHG